MARIKRDVSSKPDNPKIEKEVLKRLKKNVDADIQEAGCTTLGHKGKNAPYMTEPR